MKGREFAVPSDFTNKLLVLWLYGMVASYFYCLPVFQASHVTVTDVRAYDIVFMIGLPLLLPNTAGLALTIREYPWIRSYFYFCAWAAVSLVFTFLLGGLGRGIIAVGRLARFVMYGVVHAAILAFVRDKRTLRRMGALFFLLIVLEAAISFLQTQRVIGQLWPGYWISNYEDLPVGTLGLHHLHMGSVSVMGIALGLALVNSSRNPLVLLLIPFCIVLCVIAIFSVSSRSGYIGAGIVVLVYALFVLESSRFGLRLRRLSRTLALILGVLFLFWVGREELVSNIVTTWERSVLSRYEYGGWVALSPRRVDIWLQVLDVAVKQPWILLTGTGIQNAVYALSSVGNAAHNNYLHVLVETGFFGLYLYLTMIWQIWKRIYEVNIETKDTGEEWLSLGFLLSFLAILVMNFFNENFYMQYSLFSFTGQLMALGALAMHPAWDRADKGAKKG